MEIAIEVKLRKRESFQHQYLTLLLHLAKGITKTAFIEQSEFQVLTRRFSILVSLFCLPCVFVPPVTMERLKVDLYEISQKYSVTSHKENFLMGYLGPH